MVSGVQVGLIDAGADTPVFVLSAIGSAGKPPQNSSAFIWTLSPFIHGFGIGDAQRGYEKRLPLVLPV